MSNYSEGFERAAKRAAVGLAMLTGVGCSSLDTRPDDPICLEQVSNAASPVINGATGTIVGFMLGGREMAALGGRVFSSLESGRVYKECRYGAPGEIDPNHHI